ncbi:MAG TPA: 50S ribosomal protein L11 methyltransferase [Stellaceae bacterium]|nr:50S ribosomal protein L11 methyltransferase [Stellaceae bacterium]
MAEESIEALVGKFRNALRSRPDYPQRLLELAAVVAQKQGLLAAFELCREAIAESNGNPEVEVRAQRLASGLVSPYHVRMMNDPARTAAWDRALTRAVLPGSHVLEIGTGGGLLAMMAARAGAARVTTCERDPVLAELAREIVAINGFADRIAVIAKRSEDLVVGVDLERPAELLFGDIFGTDLLNFEPLAAIADARQRLLIPGAGAVPSFATISLALAHWRGYGSIARIDRVDGFDFGPFQRVLPSDFTLGIDDPELTLQSDPAIAFRFDFCALAAPEAERTSVLLKASADGTVTGIVQWINLQLDRDTPLETRPGEGTRYFMGCRFYPLRAPLELRKGDTLKVGAAHDGRRPIVWLYGRVGGA